MKRVWWTPLTGLVFVLLVVLVGVVAGEPPDADSPADEIVAYYVDEEGSVIAAVILSGIAATLLVFFGGSLRAVLRTAEGSGGVLSAVAFAGTIVVAVGLAIDGTITFALLESAEDVDAAAVQALQALWDNDFLPALVGTQILLLATGLSIVRHGTLPRWLGWIALLLGAVAVTPIGFAAVLGAGLWIVVVSILLARRLQRGDPGARSGAAV